MLLEPLLPPVRMARIGSEAHGKKFEVGSPRAPKVNDARREVGLGPDRFTKALAMETCPLDQDICGRNPMPRLEKATACENLVAANELSLEERTPRATQVLGGESCGSGRRVSVSWNYTRPFYSFCALAKGLCLSQCTFHASRVPDIGTRQSQCTDS